jgi:hypothetical protein
MKINKIIVLLLMLSGSAYAQEKYTLYSIPHYDSLGNLYTVKKTYDHLPTTEDSAAFRIESKNSILEMMDDNLKPTKTKEPYNKPQLKSRRKNYPIKNIKSKT